MSDDPAWQQQRRQAAADQAAALDRRKAAESERARRLLADFVHEAEQRGIRPVPLRARAYNGRSTYRTGVEGWYLARNGRIAVSTAGDYYVLTVPASARARLTGVTLTPSDPPLQIGRGARDGESIDLDALIRLRLAAGNDWPNGRLAAPGSVERHDKPPTLGGRCVRYLATVNQMTRKAIGMILGFVTFTILFMKSSGRAESWLWYVVAAVATVGSFYFWTTGQ